MLEELGSRPNNIIFWIGQLKQIFRTFVRKKKIIPFFRSEVFVLFSKFQSSCTLFGCGQRCLLPSQRSPTFAFHKPPDGVFPPNMAFASNCCESCLVEFLLLYLALFRILLAASLRSFRSSRSFHVFEPVISWPWGPFHYPTFRLFQLFGSKYRRLGSQVAELFSINKVHVHLSWYSQNWGKIVSNSGNKIRQIFGGKI